LSEPIFAAPTCPAEHQQPRRQPDGGVACIPVGANVATDASCEWPDPSAFAAPVVYVTPGTGRGTGTLTDPFHDLADALATRPGTVLLGCGVIPLAAPLTLASPVTLRGQGAGVTMLQAPSPPTTAITVDSARVALAQLTLAGDRARSLSLDDTTPALRISGATSVVTLREVRVESTGEGVRVEGGTLHAERLTLQRFGRAGVTLTEGSAAVLRDVLVRDGAGVGVLADGAWIDLRGGLIARNGRDGIALRGGRAASACANPDNDAGCPTGATSLSTSCPALALGDASVALADVAIEQQCLVNRTRVAVTDPDAGDLPPIGRVLRCYGVSSVVDVALVENNVTGVRAERLPPPPGANTQAYETALSLPGAVVRASRLVIGRTRLPPDGGLVGGDGLYVGPAARVIADPDIASDLDLGRGSQFVSNTRTGILVDGDPITVRNVLRAQGALCLAGASVLSNGGPGAYVQNAAQGLRVAFSDFQDNIALGLGVAAGGGVPLGQCNHFIGTRRGVLRVEGGAPLVLGDGLSVAEGLGRMTFENNLFENNSRFGLVLKNRTLEVIGGLTRATGNINGNGFIGTGRVTGDAAGALRVVSLPLTTPLADAALTSAQSVSAGP
jgi:hypothetical protein